MLSYFAGVDPVTTSGDPISIIGSLCLCQEEEKERRVKRR
jgi:hypothetical protein